MVDDDQIAETAQPVGKHDPAAGDGVDFAAFARADEHALPAGAVTTLAAEAGGDLARHRRAQLPFQAGKGAGRRGRTQARAFRLRFGLRFGFRRHLGHLRRLVVVDRFQFHGRRRCLRLDLARFVLLLFRQAFAFGLRLGGLGARGQQAFAFFRSDLGVSGRFRGGALFGQQLLAFLFSCGGSGLLFDQFRQLVDQVAHALFVALDIAHFLALRHQALRQARQQGGAARLLLYQQGLLVALFLRDFFQFILGVLHVRLVFLHRQQVDAQGVEQARLRLRHIGHQLQVAVDAVWIVARQEQLDAVFVAGNILRTQQFGQLRFLFFDGGRQLLVLLPQRIEFHARRALLLRQVAQGAVGVGNGLFGLGQGIGRVVLGAFRAADVALERRQLLLQSSTLCFRGRFLLAAFGGLGTLCRSAAEQQRCAQHGTGAPRRQGSFSRGGDRCAAEERQQVTWPSLGSPRPLALPQSLPGRPGSNDGSVSGRRPVHTRAAGRSGCSVRRYRYR